VHINTILLQPCLGGISRNRSRRRVFGVEWIENDYLARAFRERIKSQLESKVRGAFSQGGARILTDPVDVVDDFLVDDERERLRTGFHTWDHWGHGGVALGVTWLILAARGSGTSLLTGQVALVEYDGTQFQLLDPNAFTNLRVSGTLGVTGITTLTGAVTLSAALTYGGVTLTNAVTGTGKMVLDTSPTVNNPTVTNYVESVVAIGTVTSSSTLSLTSGTVQTATLTASTACTFTMPTATAGKSFVLLLKQAAATGNGTATFTSVKWGTAGAPTITATAGKMDILTFIADGTNWYGSIAQGYTP
jgi:hypothetical protein